MGRQDEKHDKGRQRAEDIHPLTKTGSDRGSRTDRGRRGQPVGTVAILHDDAGARNPTPVTMLAAIREGPLS